MERKLFVVLFLFLFIPISLFSEGKELWKANVKFMPKKLLTLNSGGVYICSDNSVTKFDKNGKFQWSQNVPDPFATFHADDKDNLTIISNKGNLYYIGSNGKLISKKNIKNLRYLGQSNDKKLFYISFGGTFQSVYGGTITVNQKVACIDPQGNIKWTYFTKNESLFWAKQLNNGKILLGIVEGGNELPSIYVLSKEGKFIKKLNYKSDIPIINAGDLFLFVGSDPKDNNIYLYAFSSDNLDFRWKILTATKKIHPTFFKGKIYFILPSRGYSFEHGTLKVYSTEGKLLGQRQMVPYTFSKGMIINNFLIYNGRGTLCMINDYNYIVQPLDIKVGATCICKVWDNRVYVVRPNDKLIKAIEF